MDRQQFLQKQERIIDCFSTSLDKDSAYILCEVTEEEKCLLENDKDFQTRLNFYLAREKESLIKELKTLSQSLNENIKLKAIEALGKMIYPERFYFEPEAPKKEPLTNNINIYTQEENLAQILGILAESGVFQSGVSFPTDSKDDKIHSSSSDSTTICLPVTQ